MLYKGIDGRTHSDTDYLDLYGKQVKRTKKQYPYTYNPFVIWMDDNFNLDKANIQVYSDRMREWDFDKYIECCRIVWKGCGVPINDTHILALYHYMQFVHLYFKDDMPNFKLTAIMQGCNYGNGYEHLIFIGENY